MKTIGLFCLVMLIAVGETRRSRPGPSPSIEDCVDGKLCDEYVSSFTIFVSGTLEPCSSPQVRDECRRKCKVCFPEVPDTIKQGDPMYIKHVKSGLCLTNDDRRAKLGTCAKKDTQKWKWTGKYITKRSDSEHGLYAHKQDFRDQGSAGLEIGIPFFRTIGQVCIDKIWDDIEDVRWTYIDGYLVNDWKPNHNGDQLLPNISLVPYYDYSGIHTLSTGIDGDSVGVMSRQAGKDYPYMKWDFVRFVPDTIKQGDPMYIKHVKSGLCLTNDDRRAKLGTCARKDTQKWKWSGRYITTWSDSDHGLFAHKQDFKDQTGAGYEQGRPYEETMGQVCINKIWNDIDDVRWTYVDGYLVNDWEPYQGLNGHYQKLLNISLVPYYDPPREAGGYRLQLHTPSTGTDGDCVGLMNREAGKDYPNMKWDLVQFD